MGPAGGCDVTNHRGTAHLSVPLSQRLATNQTPRPGPSDPQILRHKTLNGPPDPDPSDPSPPGPWLVQGVWDLFRVLGPSLHSLVQLGARFPKT